MHRDSNVSFQFKIHFIENSGLFDMVLIILGKISSNKKNKKEKQISKNSVSVAKNHMKQFCFKSLQPGNCSWWNAVKYSCRGTLL